MFTLDRLTNGAKCAGVTLGLLVISTHALADRQAPWQGKWVSAAPENTGSGFAKRAFNLTSNRWTLRYTAFADEAQSQPVFHIDIAGHYLVGRPSANIEGTRDAVFTYTSRTVTPLSPAGVALFAGAGCTTRLGQATDATLTGCGFVPSVMASAVEYDLVSVVGSQMRLGDRAGDLSRERPAKLSDFALVRQR
jgi:hypothetical protein